MKTKFMEDENQIAGESQCYVYLPFVKKECSEKTLQRIRKFMNKNSSENEAENQNYQFLTYGKKSLSMLPPHSKIYVTGLGINLSTITPENSVLQDVALEDHIYSISGGTKAITMETVVDRMVKDGLLQPNKLVIKLWFGDCNDRALLMAEKFITCLKDHNAKKAFRVDYYPHCIIYPPSTHGGEQHKWAVYLETKEKKRASLVRQSLFFNPDNEKTPEPSNIKGLMDFFENLNPFSR